MTFADDELVAAVHRGDVAAADDRAAVTCRAIATAISEEHRRLSGLLADAGCVARFDDPPESLQRHEIEFIVSPTDAHRALATLEGAGYQRVTTWRAGAERSFWRTSDHATLLRRGRFTTVVRLRWRPATRPTLLTRLVRPTPADWATIELPTPLWWAYPVVRPVRLSLERLGLRSDDHSALEPFLSTPDSLVGPLLDIAGVTSVDVVADIGCGDGRLVIDAARRFGCRAIGIEQSDHLARTARREADRAGVGHLVTIITSSADRVVLDDVTVVVMFLPVSVATRLVPSMIERMRHRPGARIVLHEQSALPPTMPAPDRSTAVFADDALTVAHLWYATNGRRRAHPHGAECP